MKRVFITIPIIITILCMILIGFTQASNSGKLAIEIIDNGEKNLSTDENTSITKKVIQNDNTSAVYQVKLNNKLTRPQSMEIAMAIDTSKSMGLNDQNKTMNEIASELVEKIFNGVDNVEISISDNTGIKNGLTNKNGVQTLTTTISNLQATNSNSIDQGIDFARKTFSDSEKQKVLVIFTDATDKITNLQELKEQGIEIITILTDMTRTSYEVDGESTIGYTYMLDTVDTEQIVLSLSKSIKNIVITDIFTEEIIQYFDFEVIKKSENDIVETTDKGYTWKINELKAKSTAELQFKLTLKENVEIAEEKIYQNIQTSNKLTVEYKEYTAEKTYEVTDSPIIMICEKYNITIQAVSADNKNLPVEGIEFKVIAKDEKNNIIYTDTLTTDEDGNVKISDLKTMGLITLNVQPIVNVAGYDYTDTENIVIDNNIGERKLTVKNEDIENIIDNENRKITVKFPINTKKFRLQVNLTEVNNSLVKIQGTEFRLIQPELDNKYEFSALYGETDNDGKCIFTPVIMPKKGTYDYILSQTTEHTGYESMGNVTIRITFDEQGNMTEIVSKYNKNVTAERKSESYGIINVQNKNLLTDVFNFELSLKDKNTNYPLEGALYTINVKTDEGELITYSNQKTDINGKINLALQGSGYVQIKITEQCPVLGYTADAETKELIIYRNEGAVQYVAKTTPVDLSTVVDTTNNKLIVNLQSESQNELSAIQIKLTDSKEYDVYIPNVKFTLTSLEEPIEEYTGTTDENGIINFVIQGKPQGVYAYKLEIDNNTVPSEYKQIGEEMAVSVTFDENRKLVDISDAKGTFIDFKTEIVEDKENEKVYHMGIAQIGLELSDEAATDFEIRLTDITTGDPILGTGYDINIKAGDLVRNKKDAKTNSEGIVSTRIIAADIVEIEISQTSSAVGYAIDPNKQYIRLEKVNGVYEIVEQGPYDLSDEKNGALIEENKIVFKHVNRKKAGTDIKLNLYINKMDKNENLAASVPVRIFSEDIKNSDGTSLDNHIYTDDFGYIELEKLRVPEIEIPGEGEYILYITETEFDPETQKMEDKDNTLIELKLAFRYNENKKIIELTNAEATKGNRLIKEKIFNGYETDESYESNLFLDIYTNYDEFGNFSMDFIKKNTKGETLNGAKYDVIVMRPNGTSLIRNDLEITDSVEFEGIFVTKGTTVEITEKEPPVGYELNQFTSIIKIIDVDVETLEVTAEIIDAGSGDVKTVIEGTEIIPLEDGTIKTAITVMLVDREENNFEMGIITTDESGVIAVKDATYKVISSQGYQVETPVSDDNGKSDFRIGGRYKDTTISYEITQITTGEFYKRLKDKIVLNVVFDEYNEVNAEATMNAQTDANYGITWEIDSINVENGNAINIKIKNEPQDPLTVNIETVDAVTLNKIEDISYKISPSIKISGEGIGEIKVGYVAPNNVKDYTISQLTTINTHTTSEKGRMKIVYDNDGNIAAEPELNEELELISYSANVVNIRIKLEPKTPIVLENIAYFDDLVIPNAEFKISSNKESENIITNTNGIDSVLIGNLGTNEEIIYKVHQSKAPLGYSLVEDFEIKVHYNANRVIDNVELLKTNRFVEVSYIVPSTDTDVGYNGNSNGIIKIRVKSYPELKMNIENIDTIDNTKIAGTIYQVVSTINTKDDEVITEANGVGTAHLDKTAIDEVVEYTITEKRPAALYQTMKEPVKIQVAFDSDGYIKSCEVIKGNSFATVSKKQNITKPEENFILDVKINSNKMLKINITATDSENENYVLQNASFSAQAVFNEEEISKDSVTTDVNGKATLKLDRCLESETIVYTIHQTKKNAGYQFPEEDMKFEITYDANGKIISDSVRLLQGSKYIQILNIDEQTFNIDVRIVNEETEEFGVEITAIDKYDDTIKLENVKYEAYLTTEKYAKDPEYSGEATTDKNGEAYIQLNKYNAEYGSTRTLRIIETNVPGTHREIRASILVNIAFDENGKIINATGSGGLNAYMGWIADGRFVKVTHTKHTVIVKIYHYPYLNLSVAAEDIYTGERLEGAKYRISTSFGPNGYYRPLKEEDKRIMQDKIDAVQQKIYQENKGNATLEDLISYLSTDTTVTKIKRSIDNMTAEITINESYTYTVNTYLQITDAKGPWTTSGGTSGYTYIDYIGQGLGEILQNDYTTKLNGEYDTKGIGPTEQNTTREYYIYEMQEPTAPMQYQKYIPRHLTWYYSRIIAKITVEYDGKGNIQNCTVDELRSKNNIDYNFIEVNKLENRNLEIKVKYAPTTTMEVTAIDNVSKAPLSNVRIHPYGNSTYNTRQSYEYRTINYYTTNAEGKTDYTYWGANISKDQNEYHIDTSLMSYNGYYGTGKIKIKVSYDENGRIAGADVLSIDSNGMPNAEVVGFEDNKLKINILYYRKFNMQINKKDIYDSNINLSAQFKVESDKGEERKVGSSSLTLMGIVRPGETVKYTLSETVVPNKYIPLENLEFYVTFNNDGSIKKAWSGSDLFESVYERQKVEKINAQSVKDLEINIKNEPQFSFDISTIDKFYNNKLLEGISLSIENDKGDVVIGNPTTNSSGRLNTVIGKVYPNEKVVYTIKQTSKHNGYIENNLTIKLQVEFNENGKIENYSVIHGNESVSIDGKAFKNQRNIKLTLMFTPRDIKIGIKNYNDITNESIPNVTYKITSQEIAGGSSLETTELVTNSDGIVVDVIDEFKKSETGRIVNYTISEMNIPNTYRKIQDVVLQIRYGEDGRIIASNVLSNPSNVKVKVAINNEVLSLKEKETHIILEIPNNNSYDLIIKNEDANYTNLGIKGTIYDININGKDMSKTTNSDGEIKILNRLESGNIQIKIAENTVGIGYKPDNNNITTLDIEKGVEEYSLKLNSNSNSTYADVTVSEEFGVITVTFKNETKSSIKLIKDVKDVRYNVTSKEKYNDNTYINEKFIGSDVSDEVSQEELYYELGVTPQNKTMVYSFEEMNIPNEYNSIGTIEVTVEYDMYGRIKKISDNSDRVHAVENPANSNDIVIIVSEYIDIEGTIKIIKDNKDVKYEITYKEVDEQGNYSNQKFIGSDINSIISQDSLYYELKNLPKEKTIIFTIKEVSVPDDYISKGDIEILVKLDAGGKMFEIADNCENAKATINPDTINDILVIIGGEHGSLTLIKDNEEVKYEISSKEDNGDGTYSDENKLTVIQTSNSSLYSNFEEENINKEIIYTFKETYIPEDYKARESFEIKVKYNEEGKIEEIINENDFLKVIENPEGSNDIVVIVQEDKSEFGSITLVKANKDITYEISTKEENEDGTYSNEKVMISEETAKNPLYADHEEDIVDKTIIYTFKELSVPEDYTSNGSFEIKVKYDAEGNIESITEDYDYIEAVENPEGSKDIIVIVSEAKEDVIEIDGTLMIIKDKKEVRYDIFYERDNGDGTYTDKTSIGNDSNSIIPQKELYYKIEGLQKDDIIKITIQEVSIPDMYVSKGPIEIIAKIDSEGIIEEISDNSEYVEVKLNPNGTNNIAVIVAEEYGSVSLIKDNKQVGYEISSKEDNGDGTYSNEKVLATEIPETLRDPLYVTCSDPIIDKTIIYTFKELFVPEEYEAKESFEIKVKYDSEGKIEYIVNDYEFIEVKEEPEDSNNIFVRLLTEEEIEKNRNPYTIKVVSQEIDTNLRINDSVFDIEVNHGEGNLIGLAEEEKTANIEKKGYVLEKGVIKFDDIRKAGYISVEVNQIGLADGYIYGKQKTSGTISLNIEYQKVAGEPNRFPVITTIDDDGLEVTIDNTNREVIIKVYNEPEVIMEIQTQFKEDDENGNVQKTPQEGIHYTITSQIQTTTEIIDTDLNVVTKETDAAGRTKVAVGNPYAGKSVIYTIKQEDDASYDNIGDILILVQYDTKGLIKYYEVLSALDYVEILGNEGERIISIKITNEKQRYSDNYKIVLEKHHIDDEEYGKLIPGVKFKINVREEYGEEYEWEGITDGEGVIISKEFYGYGRIVVNLTELETIKGFKLDGNTYTIRFYRDKKTGKLSIESSDKVAYEFEEDYSIVYAKPVNEIEENLHTIILNKTDKFRNELITTSSAEFEITRIETENHGTEEEPNIVEIPVKLGTISTDEKGKARLENLDSPQEPGIYKYIIKEIKAPDGYLETEEITVNIAFEYDEDNNIIINKALTEILSGDAKAISVKENLINIAIYNISLEDAIGENEYSLDITKVDANTGEAIENVAIFKVWLPDENNTAVYTETIENSLGKGKLDYCYIEQDKDYKVRLTHMKLPEEDGTLKYIFREIVPPEGYEKIEEDLELTIEFKTDEETDEMYIANATSSNTDYLIIKNTFPCPKDTRLEVDILNNLEKPKQYTISYDANDNGGDTVVPEEQVKTIGEDLILDEMVPEREGHRFLGWSTKSNATEAEYQPGDTYSKDENATLYAVWEEILYLKSTEYLIGTEPIAKDEWAPGQENAYEDGDLYIKGIRPRAGIRVYANQVPPNEGTYLEEFLSNLNTNADEINVYIPEYDSDGNIILKEENIVGKDRLMGTAMIIKLTKGKQEIQLTLIVRGDLLSNGSTVGDGKITNVEAKRVKMLSDYTLKTEYTIEEQQAIDYYMNKANRWSTNKQAIIKAYQEHKLEPIR